MAARPDFNFLLKAFTSPDNGVRRQAEAAWEDVKCQLPDEVRTLAAATCYYTRINTHGYNSMSSIVPFCTFLYLFHLPVVVHLVHTFTGVININTSPVPGMLYQVGAIACNISTFSFYLGVLLVC